MNIEKSLKKILMTKKEIEMHTSRLAKEIEKDYKDKEPAIFLGLLKGCHPFMSDLITEINLFLEVDYMDVSSFFGEMEAQSEVQIVKDMTTSVENRDVVIVEDVVDSGRTIKKVQELLISRGAKSVEVVTIVDKPSGRKVELVPKYIGKELGNDFIVGYGLDYQEYFRNIKMVGIPTEEIIKEINEKK